MHTINQVEICEVFTVTVVFLIYLPWWKRSPCHPEKLIEETPLEVNRAEHTLWCKPDCVIVLSFHVPQKRDWRLYREKKSDPEAWL